MLLGYNTCHYISNAKNNYMYKYLLYFLILLPLVGHAEPFEPKATYSVCFTPQENCTKEIVSAINNAVSNIWVQAYSFTSRPIGDALATAEERGVKVKIIFDKSILERPGTARFLARHHIPIWIDTRPNIAHNKVMIIDQATVVTGSFNFTRAAQYNNTENVLIVNDVKLAKKYLQNWQYRQGISEPFVYSSSREPELSWWEQLWEMILRWFRSLM